MHNVFRTLQLILPTLVPLSLFPEKKGNEPFSAFHFPPETPCRYFPESFPISLAARYLTHLNNFCRTERKYRFSLSLSLSFPFLSLPLSYSLSPYFVLFSFFTCVWFTRHGGRRKKRTSATMIDHRKRKPSRLKAVRTFPMSEKHSLVKPPSVANTKRGVGYPLTNARANDRTEFPRTVEDISYVQIEAGSYLHSTGILLGLARVH